MANVGQLLRDWDIECGERPAHPHVAISWLNSRYGSLLERAPYSFLLKEATFATVAEITTGTCTVTNASTTVSETTDGTNGWTSAVEGRYFRATGDNEFYPISTYTSAAPDTLTLARAYEGTTGSTHGYSIFQRFYSLASDVRQVEAVIEISSGVELEKVSQTDFDIGYINRPAVGWPPYQWAPAGRDSSDLMRIELYPIPDEAHGVLYHYIQTTPTLADQDASLIANVDARTLKPGWLADYWKWRMTFSDAPPQALVIAQSYEQEFEKRVNEFVAKEQSNFPPKRIRMASRNVRHRLGGKWSSSRGVELP